MKKINEMNQSELIEYAREIENGESGRCFEESAEYYRNRGDQKTADIFDSMGERWHILEAAATLGRKGGLSKSPAKQKASRENGKKGGRPKNIA